MKPGERLVLAEGAIAAPTPDVLDAAAARLLAGGLVAIPTETVYGLGADAACADAVASVYSTKGRPADHPLIVHVADAQAAGWWAELPAAALRLATRFWPGPLTLIVRRRPGAPAFACAGQPTIGLRCPAHPVAQALLARFHAGGGRGVAAPSANRFGRISPTRAQHVLDDLGAASPPILDGGDADLGIESTIIDLSRGAPVLLRPGAIGLESMAEALGAPVAVSVNVVDPGVSDASAPRASGTLASHYAPRTPLRIVGDLDRALRAERAAGRRVAAWRLEPQADAVAYAHALYARLRELDASGCDLILVEAPPRDAAWQAVWDRLARAAARDAPQDASWHSLPAMASPAGL